MKIFKCDICGAEIIHRPFNRLNLQRKGGVGEDYRGDSGLTISLEMDVCDKCFREKLAEVLSIPKDCRYSQSLDETKEIYKWE